MATWIKQLVGILTVLIGLISCTDQRPRKTGETTVIKPPPVDPLPLQTMEKKGDVLFNGVETQALQMVVDRTGLYLTGRPFGFSRWDLSANPESPHLTYAASDNIQSFSPDPPLGTWVLDWYASSALAVRGNFAYMSGTGGLSVVDVRVPVEVKRVPMPTRGQYLRDEAYVYRSILLHPRLSVGYGFREQDFVYRFGLSDLGLLSRDGYAEGLVCCVRGSTFFQNIAFVAMTSSVWSFRVDRSGNLRFQSSIDFMNAVNITSTANHLYVQHEPVPGNPYRAGIYVFNREGKNVAFLELRPTVFAVSSDDRYLYSNLTNTAVSIHRIQW